PPSLLRTSPPNSCQTATGLTLSSTVTVAVQVCALPLTSVTVRVTRLGPTLAQVKVFGLTLIEAMPQASLEPLLIWVAVMPALPLASRSTTDREIGRAHV